MDEISSRGQSGTQDCYCQLHDLGCLNFSFFCVLLQSPELDTRGPLHHILDFGSFFAQEKQKAFI